MASDLVHQQAAPYHMNLVHRIRPESVCPLYPSCECTNPTTALLRSWILITHRDAGRPDLLTEWRRTLVNLRTNESNCVERLGSWILIRYLTGRSRKVTNLRRHDLINIHERSLRHSTVRNYATLPHSRSPFISGCPQHPLALWWWCAWMLLMRRCLGPNVTHRLPGNPRDEDARGWAVWAFPLTTGYRITAVSHVSLFARVKPRNEVLQPWCKVKNSTLGP